VIVIETPRLFLRHFALDDLDALAEVLSDHENMRFFPNRFERKDAEEWIEKNMRLRVHNSWRRAGYFADPSGESPIAPRGRTQWLGD
jgi:RimJ/RimL family protein N-acetyltransferase